MMRRSWQASANVALALMPALVITLLLTRTIWDVDIFWQLRLGEQTLIQGRPPALEPFSALHLGEPLSTLAWLGQAIMAKVRLWWGWRGLRTFDALLWFGGFWAAGAAARRHGIAAAAMVLAIGLALIAAWPTASIRPQSFAALCFGLWLMLHNSALHTATKLLWAALLLVLWQNLHPSVAIAAITSGSLAGIGWLRVFLSAMASSNGLGNTVNKNSNWFTRRLPMPPWQDTMLTIMAIVAIFATPDGFAITTTTAANAAASLAIGQSEWLPLWDPSNRAVVLPTALIIVVSAWMLWRSQLICWRDAVPALVLFLLMLWAYRFVLFWAIAMVPVLAYAAGALLPKQRDRAWRAPWWLAPAALIVAGLTASLILPVQFSRMIPLAQLQALRSTGVKGTILAHFPWGGPAVDLGWPDWHTAYDGRYYRYSQQEWADYLATARGEIGMAALQARYHPVAWVLSPGWNASLIAELRRNSDWHILAEDDISVTFVAKDIKK